MIEHLPGPFTVDEALMGAWLKAAHVVGVVMWAGGLLALTRLLWAHARRPTAPEAGERLIAVERALYRGLCAPGLFLALFTGVFMLHQAQPLLKQPFMHAKLGLVALLFVVDHLAMRGIGRLAKGVGTVGGGRYAAAHGVAAAVVVGAAVLVLVRPWSGA